MMGLQSAPKRWLLALRDGLVRPESRRRELASVRLELLANPGPNELSEQEGRLALELRRLRVELIEAFGELRSCGECAKGQRLPMGRWDGGACCGRSTERQLNHDEVAALRGGGTQPEDLRVPFGDHAGCAFRGARGCSLAPENRPGICVRHICPQLADELRARGDYERIREMVRRVNEVFEAFRATSTSRAGR